MTQEIIDIVEQILLSYFDVDIDDPDDYYETAPDGSLVQVTGDKKFVAVDKELILKLESLCNRGKNS